MYRQINTLSIIVDQFSEYQVNLFIAFIGFEKAFECVSKKKIWKSVLFFGIPWIINIDKTPYKDSTCQVM